MTTINTSIIKETVAANILSSPPAEPTVNTAQKVRGTLDEIIDWTAEGYDQILSFSHGINGADENTVPPETGSITYNISKAVTYTHIKDNTNTAITVTAGDLTTGFVQLRGVDGVFEKVITNFNSVISNRITDLANNNVLTGSPVATELKSFICDIKIYGYTGSHQILSTTSVERRVTQAPRLSPDLWLKLRPMA